MLIRSSRLKCFLVFVMISVLCSEATAETKTEIRVMTENTPPFNYLEDDTAKGINVDVVRLIMEKTGNTAEIEVPPWARAYLSAKVQKKQVLFPMIKTPEREKHFKFACDLGKDELFLFKNKKSMFHLDSLESAKQYTIGVVNGWNAHEFLLSRGFKDLYLVNKEDQAIKMLSIGRIDLIPFSTNSLEELKEVYEVDFAEFENTNVKLYDVELCLAFSRDFSDEEVQRWQDALRLLKEDGTFQKIESKYKNSVYP